MRDLQGTHESASLEVTLVPLDRIDTSPYQPRHHFDETHLEELAASIRQQGFLQPLLVRPRGERFELVAGERRLRAARLLELVEAPVIVRSLSDSEALEAALVENLQREEISVVEAARGYERLAREFGQTLAELGRRTGKSRAAISNMLRLLQLPQPVLALLQSGVLSEGQARVLLALPDAGMQSEMADWVVRNAVPVRELERRVRAILSPRAPRSTGEMENAGLDPDTAALEERLRRKFETRVVLNYRRGEGQIVLEFSSGEELDRLLELLGL